MGTISVGAELLAAPRDVFDILRTPATWPHWFTIHDRFVDLPPARLDAGSRMNAKVTLLDISLHVAWEVKSCTEPASLTIAGSGPVGVGCEFTYTLTPAETGTMISAEGTFGGPMVRGSLNRALEKNGTIQLTRSLGLLGELAAAVDGRAVRVPES
ncbi:type II toxin-antitoxin system Rv0910 family toxin [Nocardia cyriacigeorgica]|uniref:type II toxin-antitoxin system Rv0910 family toxin n=1 Tax=Nocardia cyriacigeorgica TaxID=135487 RepID=UPI00248F6E26|nr:SRPBCC family protein [Nocardia cyriacigeorgica]BDU06804.1 hypothetical protein FMUBM48_30670 [Nocardia cyriacigeorgica]